MPPTTPFHANGPMPPFLARTVGPLLAAIYGWEISRRNRAFDQGADARRFDRPVVSVGNLSVGGTGKTPMVKAIIGWLTQSGRRPCIAMRGYKASKSHGSGLPASDEAREYAATLPTWADGTAVPVVAQPDRSAGLAALFQSAPGAQVDVIVLDDGFQHRRIARDLDIVLIDATRDPWADRLLPWGWLRESPASLARAGAVVVTHAQAASDMDIQNMLRRIAQVAPTANLAVTEHRWTRLRGAGQEHGELDLAFARGKRALAVCAIGNPAPFLHAAARACGEPLAGSIILPDHDSYADATVQRIIRQARQSDATLILTTEKDWTKLSRIDPARWPAPVVRPVLEITFRRGESDLRSAVAAL